MTLAEALAKAFYQMESEPEWWQVDVMRWTLNDIGINPDIDVEQAVAELKGPG
jgi:hypothetical protein